MLRVGPHWSQAWPIFLETEKGQGHAINIHTFLSIRRVQPVARGGFECGPTQTLKTCWDVFAKPISCHQCECIPGVAQGSSSSKEAHGSQEVWHGYNRCSNNHSQDQQTGPKRRHFLPCPSSAPPGLDSGPPAVCPGTFLTGLLFCLKTWWIEMDGDEESWARTDFKIRPFV